METNKILVTLIDPQPLFREGVKTILQSTNEIEVIEQLDSLRNITKKESMHILLIHVSEFMQERYELSQTYLGRNSNVKVVVLADVANEEEIVEVMRTNVDGFLLKDMGAKQFVDAIKQIAKGIIYIDPTLSKVVLKEYNEALTYEATLQEVLPPIHLYTKRECEILQLLTDGQSNNNIAAILQISEKTVKNHVSNLFKKMNVHSRTEAVTMAIRNNWVSLM
ncbi:MAG TPA: response regulator transcription factor [Pseudogracilibacillus sp.]|nr:response regulator transcription factor [Pseudogracilibacillus sp.]